MPDDLPEFDESLMPAVEPPALADIELTSALMDYARRRWPDASQKMQEYRVRQTIWVRFQHRKQHPDDPGRRVLGGAQPNAGRKPQKHIGAAIVEHFEGRQKEVLDAIGSALDPKVDPAVRHKAGMNIAKHAREERAMEIVEDEYARRTDEDIRRETAAMFAEMVRNGEIKPEEFIDGSATDITDEDQKQIAS